MSKWLAMLAIVAVSAMCADEAESKPEAKAEVKVEAKVEEAKQAESKVVEAKREDRTSDGTLIIHRGDPLPKDGTSYTYENDESKREHEEALAKANAVVEAEAAANGVPLPTRVSMTYRVVDSTPAVSYATTVTEPCKSG